MCGGRRQAGWGLEKPWAKERAQESGSRASEHHSLGAKQVSKQQVLRDGTKASREHRARDK